MNRYLRRKLDHHAKDIDKILKKELRKELKRREINFLEKNGEFLSDQNEMVKKLYENTKMTVLISFLNVKGDIHQLKKIYE